MTSTMLAPLFLFNMKKRVGANGRVYINRLWAEYKIQLSLIKVISKDSNACLRQCFRGYATRDAGLILFVFDVLFFSR